MPRRPDRDSQAALFRAAAHEFAERGYEAGGVDRIAARARVNKAMLYYHYGSKLGLYTEILRDMFRAVGVRARAIADRRLHDIPDDWGTAVTVQAMVFGNMGEHSATGVVFTRDPSTGAPGPYGDYLPRAQGEDVVAGNARCLEIARMVEHEPDAHQELLQVLRRLEIHYRDVCDVEFTVEEGRLWLLQTRVGKRGAVAAVRIAARRSSSASRKS